MRSPAIAVTGTKSAEPIPKSSSNASLK